MWPKCGPNAAQMRPKCGPNAARMWPEYEILWPVINPWTFPVARARPEPKPQARNPARTMKKVARPSPRVGSMIFETHTHTHSPIFEQKMHFHVFFICTYIRRQTT